MEAELQAASEEIKARKEEEGRVTTGKKYCIVYFKTAIIFVPHI